MQHVGAATVLVTVLMGLALMTIWKPKIHRSFSEHVADRRASQLLFSALMVLVTVVYYWFLFVWLGPHLALPTFYYWMIAFLFVMQFIVAVVPASKKPWLHIHTTAALIVAFGMIAFGVIVAWFGDTALWLRILSGGYAATGLWVMYLYTFVPKSHRHYLIYELSMFGAFWVLVTLLTYL